MTNLVEFDKWEDGIYQLETSDPVQGGPEGVDNLRRSSWRTGRGT